MSAPRHGRERRPRVDRSVRTNLWLFPMAFALAAIVLARALVTLDSNIPQRSQAWFLFGGQAESARAFLSTIASSIMTFTGLVFSITILVLQLASSQFSPRVLRTFLEDRLTRLSMGVFIGSFVYALVVLQEVHGETPRVAAFVPALSVFVALVLVLLSVAVFVRYIHHMAHSIRAVHLVRRLADEGRSSMEVLYPEGAAEEPDSPPALPAGPPDARVLNDGVQGVLTAVDEEALFALAIEHGLVVELVPLVGDFVPRKALLFRIWGARDAAELEVARYLTLAEERTPAQDPAFAFRQLVDVAERALSPGINDPTTAVQALDQIHDLLRALATRRFPSPARVDAANRLRLVLPRPDWDAFVRLGLDEIRQYGERSLQVSRRLRALLEDLLAIAPPPRQAVLREQLALLESAVTRAFPTARERDLARRPNVQGHGQA